MKVTTRQSYPSGRSVVTRDGEVERIAPSGPGEELKKLLHWFWIDVKPGCQCSVMAAQMNRWGAEGCREHMDEILDAMQSEAKRRDLPFVRAGAAMLVRLAIRMAGSVLI